MRVGFVGTSASQSSTVILWPLVHLSKVAAQNNWSLRASAASLSLSWEMCETEWSLSTCELFIELLVSLSPSTPLSPSMLDEKRGPTPSRRSFSMFESFMG